MTPTEELCPCCGKPRKCEREPREWWFRVYRDGTIGSPSDEKCAIEWGQHELGSEIVHVIEIIE